MLRRLGLGLGAGVLLLVLLAYAAVVLPAMPWWVWPIAVVGTWIIRRWWRVRRLMAEAGTPTEGGPLWSPTRGGGK